MNVLKINGKRCEPGAIVFSLVPGSGQSQQSIDLSRTKEGTLINDCVSRRPTAPTVTPHALYIYKFV